MLVWVVGWQIFVEDRGGWASGPVDLVGNAVQSTQAVRVGLEQVCAFGDEQLADGGPLEALIWPVITLPYLYPTDPDMLQHLRFVLWEAAHGHKTTITLSFLRQYR